MPYLTALITVLALMVYIAVFLKVGKARGTYGVKAPATTGNEAFERVYRVQMNTLEQLVLFLPALWLFSAFAPTDYSEYAVAVLGGAWLVGRVLYARAYYAAPAKRAAGFIISFFAASLLLLGALAGIVMHLVAGA
ncbi:MAG: MAPEG family protein [Pseudomonadota bacterium]